MRLPFQPCHQATDSVGLEVIWPSGGEGESLVNIGGGFTLATSTILTKISYLFYFVDVTYSVADLDPRAFTSDSSLRGCAVASN